MVLSITYMGIYIVLACPLCSSCPKCPLSGRFIRFQAISAYIRWTDPSGIDTVGLTTHCKVYLTVK